MVTARGEGGDVSKLRDECWSFLGFGLGAFVDCFGEADVAVGTLIY